jgi:hypothetical protein
LKSLPYSLFRAVQGLSYPRRTELLVLGEWDTSDWNCTQKVVRDLSVNTEIAVIPLGHANTEMIMKRFQHIDYKFHIVIYGYSRIEMESACRGMDSVIVPAREAFIGIIVHKLGSKSFLRNQIDSNKKIKIDDPQFFLPDFNPQKWVQKGNQIIFTAPELDVHFTVPDKFSLKLTSLDLLWAIENVLLSPWHEKYNNEWVPMRRPGGTPGLSFSGGVDSAAAMCLMPSNTRLFYLERDFESMIQHENAHRFINRLEDEGREVISIQSNHEKIRTFHTKKPGFSTDYACMAHLILVSDYYDLDAAGTGMPLENAYFFHGSKIRDFEESSFWKKYAPMFSYLGIPIYQPVAGCSEIVNNTIVNESGYKGFATSCLRSNVAGKTCNSCWKCFRKNTFNGLNWEMSPEISTFLSKRPLKQGIATLFALQMNYKRDKKIPVEVYDLLPLMGTDLNFLNMYWSPSLELLPSKYRAFTEQKLVQLVPKMEMDLYSLDSDVTRLLRGNDP